MSKFDGVARYMREALREDILTGLDEISGFSGHNLDRTEVLIKNGLLPAFRFGTGIFMQKATFIVCAAEVERELQKRALNRR